LHGFIIAHVSNRPAARFGRKFAMREKTDIHPSRSVIKSCFSTTGTDILVKWLYRLIGRRRSLPFTLILSQQFTPDYCSWSSYHNFLEVRWGMSYSLYEEYYYLSDQTRMLRSSLPFIISFYSQPNEHWNAQ